MNRFQEALAVLLRAPGTVEKKLETSVPITGDALIGGFEQTDEVNTDWIGEQKYKTIQRMIRTDPTVASLYLGSKLPIVAGDIQVKPADDSTEAGRQADFVSQYLIESEHINFTSFLDGLLDFLVYGFSLHSKQYGVENNKLIPIALDYIPQDTVDEWFTQPGGLKAVNLFGYDSNSDTYNDVTVDAASKLFLMTNRLRRINFYGESAIRPCYAAFSTKQDVIRAHSLHVSRFRAGMPKGTVTKTGIKSAVRTAYKNVLRKVATAARGYILNTPEFEIEIPNATTYSASGIANELAGFDAQILQTFLAQFLALGTGGGGGSYALSATQVAMFQDTVDSIALRVGQAMCKGFAGTSLVKQMIDLNFPAPAYPQILIKPKQSNRVLPLIDKIPNLLQSGALTSGEELETMIRGVLDIPEETTEKAPQIETSKRVKFRRKLDPQIERFEKDIMQTGEMRKFLNARGEDARRVAEGADGRVNQILVEKGVRILSRVKSLEELEKQYNTVVLKAEISTLRNEIKALMNDAFEFGEKMVKHEIAAQGMNFDGKRPIVETGRGKTIAALSRLAGNLARDFVEKKLSSWRESLLGLFLRGDTSSESIRGDLTRVSPRKLATLVGGKINEANGLGRNTTIERALKTNPAAKLFRSEVLDENTCAPCRRIDGKQIERGSSLFNQTSAGAYSQCEGRSNCRGVNIIVHQPE